MTPAERIIDQFGGLSALARALGHKNPTTVQGWKERGVIPLRRWSAVKAAAAKEGIEIEDADFIPSEEAA